VHFSDEDVSGERYLEKRRFLHADDNTAWTVVPAGEMTRVFPDRRW